LLSKLWYAAPVWLSRNILKQKEISQLNTADGNVVKDNEKALNGEELQNLLKIPFY
jgi:hypothetical protein